MQKGQSHNMCLTKSSLMCIKDSFVVVKYICLINPRIEPTANQLLAS